MGPYDKTDDGAYAVDGLASLTAAERTLFEDTLTAIGVPPTMLARARINLHRKHMEEGEDGVRTILERARQQRAIRAWLERRVGSERTSDIR